MSDYTLKWWQFTRRSHCPHSNLLGIYGDEINRVGGYRLQCASCGKYLDGPVSLIGRNK